MKILIIVPGGVDPSGEKAIIPALLSLYKQLSTRHEVVIIATRHHSELKEYRLMGCEVISLPQMRNRQLFTMRNLALKRLNGKNFKPDIVHSIWLGTPSFLGALLSFHFKVPHLSSIGGGELTSFKHVPYGGCHTLRGKFYMWLNMKISKHLSFGSQYVLDTRMLKVSKFAKVVPLGIDLNFWEIKETHSIKTKQWNILWLASINLVKNPVLMLDVVEILKNSGLRCHIHVVGVDTLDGAIQSQANRRGLQSYISFYGYREQKDVREIMSDMQFILQTSHFESQGVAMAEAVSQGLCPVGTAVGWLSDMGIGIDADREGSANVLANEIHYFAENTDGRLKRVQEIQQWLQEHDAAYTAIQFEDIYTQLVAARDSIKHSV